MTFEDKYLFVGEFTDGEGCGLPRSASEDLNPEETQGVRQRRRESSPNNKVKLKIQIKQNGISSFSWSDFFFKSFHFMNILSYAKASDEEVHEILDSDGVVKRKERQSTPSKWIQWLYETENTFPEPTESENTASLSEREHVNIHELEEYLNIEPRMRCHHHADSLFSTSSGFTNYRGILNWLIVILLCSMGRVALENVIKYGILIRPFDFLDLFIENPYEWRCLRLVLLTNIYILIIFWVERLLSQGKISHGLGLILNSLTLVSVVLVPGFIVFTSQPNPMFSSVTLGIQAIAFLKLVSYVQVNQWCRDQVNNRKNKRKRLQTTSSSAQLTELDNGSIKGIRRELVSYPDNVTLQDLYYFIFAPTLCYELNFPRSERIRKRFLVKRILEMVFLAGLMIGLVQQWIVPIVLNSRVPFKELAFFRMLERLLKLSVPNHLIWLIFFYWGFHSCLNAVAEVLRFGDRIFYRDWWNAENIREFWKNWNIPVHRWAIRHLYKPLVAAGYTPGVASVAVFCVSAFFHEYLVSVPLNMFRLWAFMAMLGQVPLAYMTRYMDQKMGNIVVWLSLIIGQPAALLMYYHDYYLTHLAD